MRLIQTLVSGTVYAQIWEERIKLAHVERRTVFDEKPYIAIDSRGRKPVVTAVGDAAAALGGSAGMEVSNPFSHPRLLVSRFDRAEKVLQYSLRRLFKHAWLAPKPLLVIHPREKLEGGMTDVERRLFKELGLGAGAREVRLHLGNEIPLSHFRLALVNEGETGDPAHKTVP